MFGLQFIIRPLNTRQRRRDLWRDLRQFPQPLKDNALFRRHMLVPCTSTKERFPDWCEDLFEEHGGLLQKVNGFCAAYHGLGASNCDGRHRSAAVFAA